MCKKEHHHNELIPFVKRISGLLLGISIFANAYSQNWEIEELPNMPEPVSNNAVCSVIVDDTLFVYSFAGIDSSKKYTGIHNKAYSYNSKSKKWKKIKDLPDSLGGLIAASASELDGKIYIMGGYHVYADGSEKSSYENRLYDPVSNFYTRLKDIPIPIDDHVQIVYKHYIYLISGWTHTINGGNNTNAVQIYDTKNDNWLVGTSTPNSTKYKVFGASGALLGNTIYYIGGARYGNNFPLMDILRKGEIDENDPTKITWTDIRTENSFKTYRSVLFPLKQNSSLHCIGGSSTSYNYNGLAYDGSGGVEPNSNFVNYGEPFEQWSEDTINGLVNMDLRGYAQVSDHQLILVGGMEKGQKVSSKVIQLTYKEILNVKKKSIGLGMKRPFYTVNNQLLMVEGDDVERTILKSMSGETVAKSNENFINIQSLSEGIYILKVGYNDGTIAYKKIGIY